MKDQLEEFCKKHKSEFNQHEPDAKVWVRIQSELHPAKPKSTKNIVSNSISFFWRSAAIILLGIVTILLYQNYNQKESSLANYSDSTYFSSELQKAEAYYLQIINEKKTTMQHYALENTQLTNEFEKDLAALDSTYSGLQKELIKNTNDERIINAMIRNLQLRINVLNEQINVLNKVKKSKDDETKYI